MEPKATSVTMNPMDELFNDIPLPDADIADFSDDLLEEYVAVLGMTGGGSGPPNNLGVLQNHVYCKCRVAGHRECLPKQPCMALAWRRPPFS